METKCSIEDCGRVTKSRDWCAKHYLHWLRYGDPLPRASRSVSERFWAKVTKTDSCWIWNGGKAKGGYGKWSYWLPESATYRQLVAHRFAYELLIGPIPERFTLDHLCRTRLCVRPDHMEAVTMRENLLRGETFQAANARKTGCPKGHPYDRVSARGGRWCSACHAASMKRRGERLKEARRSHQ